MRRASQAGFAVTDSRKRGGGASAKAQTYCMQAGGETLGYVQATTPAKALRAYFGSLLASQDGRYGSLTDGRTCVALLVHGGRRYLGGNEGRR